MHSTVPCMWSTLTQAIGSTLEIVCHAERMPVERLAHLFSATICAELPLIPEDPRSSTAFGSSLAEDEPYKGFASSPPQSLSTSQARPAARCEPFEARDKLGMVKLVHGPFHMFR